MRGALDKPHIPGHISPLLHGPSNSGEIWGRYGE